jgi:hypothetical protein
MNPIREQISFDPEATVTLRYGRGYFNLFHASQNCSNHLEKKNDIYYLKKASSVWAISMSWAISMTCYLNELIERLARRYKKIAPG